MQQGGSILPLLCLGLFIFRGVNMDYFFANKHELKTKMAGQCWNDLQFVGLQVAGLPSTNKVLLFGGKRSFQYDGQPFTGCVTLYVGQGGLRNQSAALNIKKLFKKAVMPVIAGGLLKVEQKYTGKLELHFSEGCLITLNMAH